MVWVVPVRAEGRLGWYRGIALLGAADRERADRFVNEADRNRLAVSRVALQDLVMTHRFATREGMPEIVHEIGQPPTLSYGNLSLSLAHAGDLVVCAAAESPIGVDVEAIPGPAPTETLWRRVLSARERHALAGVSPDSENVEFVRLWVRKEAVLKAVGTVTIDDLARIDVLDGETAFPDPSRPWQLRDLPVGEGHLAAVAMNPHSDLKVHYPTGAGS